MTNPASEILQRGLRRLGALAAVTVALAGAPPPAMAQPIQSELRSGPSAKALATTVEYVSTFYPLWFTYYQSQVATQNRLVGPARVSSLYHIVVAINVDTLYASTFLSLAAQPVILTVPASSTVYSVLTLDPYGNVFESGVPSQPPGTSLAPATYALAGPGYTGPIPAGTTRISMPLDVSIMIFRVDKFSPSGQDQMAQAESFRSSIRMQALCDYSNTPCPNGEPHDTSDGKTLILPEVAFAIPFKTIADTLATYDPIGFLRQLQAAVNSSNTPAMSTYERNLANDFDRLFGNGHFGFGKLKLRADLAAGTRLAHELIVERYLRNEGENRWIHFTNIGKWGDHVLDRAAITEYIQYGNDISAAAYYHAFRDEHGIPLHGSPGRRYVLKFAKGQQPEASRFWSLTAYTPEAIELVANPANKYVVASYTPGLVTAADGSVTIYMSIDKPLDQPEANWLPIPPGPFNVMLRVYGPEGSVASDTYVPPAVVQQSP